MSIPTIDFDDISFSEYLEEQQLGEEDARLLREIYERVDIFEQQNREDHEEAKECRRIIHLDDPKQDDPKTLEKTGKKTLQLQTLKSTYNNVVADQMLSMPEVRCLPETAELQEQADDLQDLCHHVIYNVNNFEDTHKRRCEDFYCTGEAVTQIAWDQDMSWGKGDIALIRWPIEAFLWDPMADNLQDCRAVMKVSWHPRSWYKEHYPDKYQFIGSDQDAHNNVGMTAGQEDAKHSNDEERTLLIEYWWRTYNAHTHRYSINVAYAAGNALLEVEKDVYAHGLYPFVIDVHDTKEGCITGEGLVHELVNMMRYINRYASYADTNARASSRGRLLVNEQAGIDMEALIDYDKDIITGQRIDPQAMQWMQTQPFPASIINLMTMLQSDLKADSGANQFTRGETTGGIVSGKAINSLIQAGGKIASMRTEQLKAGFKEMVEQIIWLMAQFYDEDRVVMVTGRTGVRKEIKVKGLFPKLKGAVPPPPYTVQIEIASKDPQRVANINQMFMEAFTMAAQTPNPMRLSDLFRILDLDGKDRILPVIEENEHYGEMMQQMQQQLEEAQMQIQQLQEENQSVRKEATNSANALARIAKQRGGNVVPQAGGGPTIAAPNSPETTSALVNGARADLGQPVLPE